MKQFLIVLGLSLLILSCGTSFQRSNWRRFNRDYSRKIDLTDIEYLGGDGSSIENAIIIKNAGNSENGIASEHAYIEKQYGKRTIDWEIIKQSLDEKEGKVYDILQIQIILDNQVKILYFDITDFFGKH
jgi:hypothetical protein